MWLDSLAALCMRVKSLCMSVVTPGCLTCNHGRTNCESLSKVVLFAGIGFISDCLLVPRVAFALKHGVCSLLQNSGSTIRCFSLRCSLLWKCGWIAWLLCA